MRFPPALGLAAALVLLGACSESTAPSGSASSAGEERSDSSAEESAELSSYWQQNQQLGEFHESAESLPQRLDGASPQDCAAVSSELDAAGSPERLAELAMGAPDDMLGETLLEQQAAVSSVMAACRGEAPISLAEAVEELRLSNEATRDVLAAAGLR